MNNKGLYSYSVAYEDENEFLERILFQGGGGLGDGVNVDSEQTQTTSGVPRQCNTVDADPG